MSGTEDFCSYNQVSAIVVWTWTSLPNVGNLIVIPSYPFGTMIRVGISMLIVLIILFISFPCPEIGCRIKLLECIAHIRIICDRIFYLVMSCQSPYSLTDLLAISSQDYSHFPLNTQVDIQAASVLRFTHKPFALTIPQFFLASIECQWEHKGKRFAVEQSIN